jgi:uncharacterized DUF497 family protein
MAIYFEWDEDKAIANLRHHGIDFADARSVFHDPYRLVEEDSVVDGEQRWRTLGTANGIAIVLVIHLEEALDYDMFVRIISAGRPRRRKGATMSKIVRMTSETSVSSEAVERLTRLANMPDAEIRTDLIPERRFDLKRAAERREAGWAPHKAHRKAS